MLLGGSQAPDALPPNVVATYGMTETGSGVVYDGVPLDGVEVAFRPTDARRGLRDGDAGGRDPHPGPHAASAATATASDGRVVGTRRLVGPGSPPGTPAVSMPTGRSSVSGRIDDVITTGGEKVWPDLVERVLVAHPGVAEVAVWKRPDPEWGERVVAWVVPGDDGAVARGASSRWWPTTIAPWAAPKELVLVDDLPRTAAGKVRRRALE